MYGNRHRTPTGETGAPSSSHTVVLMSCPNVRWSFIPALLMASVAFAQPAPQQKTNPQQPATREVAALPSFANLVESVKSAVVNVDVQAKVQGHRGGSEEFGGGGDDLFEHFFGDDGEGLGPRSEERYEEGAGSGFIIDPSGIIITNNHVVEDATYIEVTLDDGRVFSAQVVGRDPLTDVAVIKIKENVNNLPAVKLGNSDAMRVGDWVVAIGNPFGLASSVSAGIVSATARNIHVTRYDEFIQTDAAINPGNSGGPLFNLKGEVIGMNTAIVGGGAGIGFAVPSVIIKSVVPQLQQTGKVVRGYLGVGIQDLTTNLAQALKVPSKDGAIITEISPKSPAANVLKPDDVVVSLNGQKVDSAHSLSRMVAMLRPGTQVTLDLYRGGKQTQAKVTLGTRPDLEGAFKEKRTLPQAERQQKIGLAFQDMDPRYAQGTGLPSHGALIQEVRPGSPAERADLRPGMVVIQAAGQPVKNAKDLEKAIRGSKPGSILLLRVVDEGGKSLRALPIPQ